MNADQAPVSTDKRYWTKFLGQDTAFYVGAEQIARATRLPIMYMVMRRVQRGYYEVELRLLWDGREALRTERTSPSATRGHAKSTCSKPRPIGSGRTAAGG